MKSMMRLYQSRRQIISKLVSSLLFLRRRDTPRQRFVDELIADLLSSAWITLAAYFFLFIVFYLSIKADLLLDPAQRIECLNNNNIKSDSSLTDLTRRVDWILHRLGLDKTTFVCYSTLFELLHTGRRSPASKRLDLCVYDPNLESGDIIHPLLYTLGWSQLERELNANLIPYKFNRLFGYYRLDHMDSHVYLYVFAHAPRDKYAFESIRRVGFFYLQFERLLDLFLSSMIASKSSSVAHHSTTSPSVDSRVSLLNRLQIYMIDEMFIRVNLLGDESTRASHDDRNSCCFYSLPVDPYDVLANFYPSVWYTKYFMDNCSTSYH